jgi:hypothetical protein
MAFDAQKLNALVTPLGNGAIRFFSYETDESEDNVVATDFMPNAADYGVKLYDIIIVSPASGAEEPYFLTVDAIDAAGNATLVNSARFGSDTLSYRDKAAVGRVRVPASADNILVSAYDATANPSAGRANYRAASDADYAATPALLRLTDATGRKFVINEPTVHVAMAGAVGDGVTDDTAAINAVFAYLRASLTTPQSGRKYYLTGAGMMCRIEGSVDATLIRAYHNWGVRDLFIDAHCTGKVALDFTGSRYGHLENIYVWGDQTDTPSTGIQFARWDTGSSVPAAGEHLLTNVSTDGYFTKAGHHNYGCETNTYVKPMFWNKYSGAYALIMDGDASQTPTSDFVTVASGYNSFLENLFLQADIRQLTSGPAMYIKRADEIDFINSYGVSMDDVIVDAVLTSTRAYHWKFDMHAEAVPDIDAFMRISATDASVELVDLSYRDHSPHGDDCLFIIDASVTVAKIFGFKLDIGNWSGGVTPPSKVFDTPSKIHLHDCDALVPSLAGFNTLSSFAAFSGHVYARDQVERMEQFSTHYNDSSTSNSTTAGAVKDFYRNGVNSPGDGLHYLRFYGHNSAAEKTQYAGILPSIASATDGAEGGQLNFATMNNAGAFLAHLSVGPVMNTTVLPLQLATYTVAGLPGAAARPRCLVYVSNESGGQTVAYSDGTNWRRVYDNAVVS